MPNVSAQWSPNLSVWHQGCGWPSTWAVTHKGRGSVHCGHIHPARLKGSLQVLCAVTHPEGDRGRGGQASQKEQGKLVSDAVLLKHKSGQATTPLLPVSQRKSLRPPVACKTLRLFSDARSQLADLSCCPPASLTGTLPFLAHIKHSPQGLWTCGSSAGKSLPDSCTAHSSLYLGLCSHVTIREVPWPPERAAPPPRHFHPSRLTSFLFIHSFIACPLSLGCGRFVGLTTISPVHGIVLGALALMWWALINVLNKWRKKLLIKWRKVLHIPHSEMKRRCHKINMYL